MSSLSKRFYKNRVALNVLANSVDNAKDIFQATEGMLSLGCFLRITHP